MAIRILVADDSETVCNAISALLRASASEWQVCAVADDGEAAVQKAAALKPDLVLLDFVMPQRDGLSAARSIRAFLPQTPIIFYTMFATPYLEYEAKEAGAHAVVQKPNGAGLVAAIRAALAGNPPFGRQNFPPSSGTSAI